MPLKAGKSNIGSNIREMQAAGHPHTQAVAAALRTAYGAPRAAGGLVEGETGGRSDEVSTQVPDGAHIIPADVVSALGQGNTLAGAAKLRHKFPHSTKAPGLKSGGVPVKLSDGEFSVSPEDVRRVGEGDIERGHRALNAWIMHVRQQDIKHRQNLPPPATR